MTNKDKSIAFSNGDFEKIYEWIAGDAVWNVVEEDTFTGKQAIVKNCEQVSNYFRSVTTNFNTLHAIQEGQKVVVNGTAEFLREGKRVSFISACDLYEFNDKDQIKKITSYCIQHIEK